MKEVTFCITGCMRSVPFFVTAIEVYTYIFTWTLMWRDCSRIKGCFLCNGMLKSLKEGHIVLSANTNTPMLCLCICEIAGTARPTPEWDDFKPHAFSREEAISWNYLRKSPESSIFFPWSNQFQKWRIFYWIAALLIDRHKIGCSLSLHFLVHVMHGVGSMCKLIQWKYLHPLSTTCTEGRLNTHHYQVVYGRWSSASWWKIHFYFYSLYNIMTYKLLSRDPLSGL
jgi:hypothetical protein